MKKITSIFSAILFAVLCLMSFNAEAHSGRTDSNGGHTNHATGDYHYHHGCPAHYHYDIDGDGSIDCPYTFDYDSTSEAESTTSNEKIEFSIPYYPNDFSMPAFSHPEYTQMPKHNNSTSESSNAPPAYVSLSIMGVVVLIMIIAYIFGRRR